MDRVKREYDVAFPRASRQAASLYPGPQGEPPMPMSAPPPMPAAPRGAPAVPRPPPPPVPSLPPSALPPVPPVPALTPPAPVNASAMLGAAAGASATPDQEPPEEKLRRVLEPHIEYLLDNSRGGCICSDKLFGYGDGIFAGNCDAGALWRDRRHKCHDRLNTKHYVADHFNHANSIAQQGDDVRSKIHGAVRDAIASRPAWVQHQLKNCPKAQVIYKTKLAADHVDRQITGMLLDEGVEKSRAKAAGARAARTVRRSLRGL